MKLSKIYCDQEEIFAAIKFKGGINFILSDDHSVGKSTLFKLIDFLLFKGKPNFLKLDNFNDLSFFLEIKIKENSFITIKRSTFGRANDCLKLSNKPINCVNLSEGEFDFKGSEKKALDFFHEKTKFKFSNIRHYLSYFLRDQDNQSDEFRLNKFLRSNDIDYKPIVANLLGIDGEKIRKKYSLEDTISNNTAKIKTLEQNLGLYKSKDLIVEEISVYENNLGLKVSKYDDFDFYLSEHDISQELVDNVELNISNFNSKRNSLKREIDYINNAIRSEISIEIEDISGLFKEIEIIFPEDLKKNYESVIEFNRQITKERKEIFKENKVKFENELELINSELKVLNGKRKELLGILNETDTMSKFKKLENEIIELKASIKSHNDKLTIFNEIDNLKDTISNDSEQLTNIIKNQELLTKVSFVDDLKKNIKMIGKIVFGERDLAFSVGFNTQNNLEFHLKISNSKGFDNFEEDGNTVKKLLCFVFSASLVLAHNSEIFIQFLAFDSPFDGDKNIWQNGVFNAIKKLESEGVQTLITTITDEVKNVNNLNEIKDKYVRRTLSEKNKLLGDF